MRSIEVTRWGRRIERDGRPPHPGNDSVFVVIHVLRTEAETLGDFIHFQALRGRNSAAVVMSDLFQQKGESVEQNERLNAGREGDPQLVHDLYFAELVFVQSLVLLDLLVSWLQFFHEVGASKMTKSEHSEQY